MIPPEAPQLMLRVENHTLTFGLEAKNTVFKFMLYNYKKKYRNDVNSIEILKCYNLPNKDDFYLHYRNTPNSDGSYDFDSSFWEPNCKDGELIKKSEKCIYELLESLLKHFPVDAQNFENFLVKSLDLEEKTIYFTHVFIGISLSSKKY
jgi:hypothetical protein